MKKILKLILIASFLLFELHGYSRLIPLDSKNIHVTGAAYVFRSPEKLFYKRFSEKALNAPDSTRMFNAETASTTSGIIIQFKTQSPFIHLTFFREPGLNRQGFFKILKDGEDLKTILINGIKSNIQITLDSLPLKKEAVYEVVLPSLSNFSLTRLELDDDSKLIRYQPVKRKIYLAYGNSITHGAGQDGASYLTYPFLLSQKLNMDLYNLAIGGAKISVPVADMSKDFPKANIITVLIGYNDMQVPHTIERFEKDYREYLAKIRENQHRAKIFCITLLYTKKKENSKTHLTPDDFRNAVKKIVAEYQSTDKKLYLVEGDKITSLENLKPGADTDPVHLTVKGAELFAEALYKEIVKNQN